MSLLTYHFLGVLHVRNAEELQNHGHGDVSFMEGFDWSTVINTFCEHDRISYLHFLKDRRFLLLATSLRGAVSVFYTMFHHKCEIVDRLYVCVWFRFACY